MHRMVCIRSISEESRTEEKSMKDELFKVSKDVLIPTESGKVFWNVPRMKSWNLLLQTLRNRELDTILHVSLEIVLRVVFRENLLAFYMKDF